MQKKSDTACAAGGHLHDKTACTDFGECMYGSYGMTFPILNASLASLAETETRAIVMAVNGTILRLSQSVAPLFFGIVWTLYEWHGPYMLGICVALLIGSIAASVFHKG